MIKQSTWDAPINLTMEGGQDRPPLLILGTLARQAAYQGDIVPQDWTFAPGREWLWLDHQAGGTGCTHPEFVCTILRWRPDMEAKFLEIAERYDGSDLGVFNVTLTSINRYEAELRQVHPALTCDESYADLQEAVYPIDCTPAAIAALTDEALPPNLDELVQWKKELHQFLGHIGRWRLWVLSENSD